VIDCTSTMPDVVAGLLHADDAACHEFVRRQLPAAVAPLGAAAKSLGAAVWTLQWADSPRMMRWKYPDVLPSLPLDKFRAALEAGLAGDESAAREQLSGLSLELLATAGSVFAKLQMIVTQRLEGRLTVTVAAHSGEQDLFAGANHAAA